MKRLAWVLIALLTASCALYPRVRQEDLDAWKGQPVEKLDLHPLFASMPMEKRTSSDGVEVRTYRNSAETSYRARARTHDGFGGPSTEIRGTASEVVCSNVFYVWGGKVIKYQPVGRCFTNESVQPR